MSEFLSRSIPSMDSRQLEHGIELANRELLSCGITSIQDASFRNDAVCWERFQRWKHQDSLKPRVSMMLGVNTFEKYRKEDFSSKIEGEQLCITGVKIIVDETTGRLNPSQGELNKLVSKIQHSGFQAIIHAIEEPAIEAACIAIEYALQMSSQSDHRHRIEHCSVCPPSLARRLSLLGVMVVTQPPFIYYNGDRYLETVPKQQLKSLYPIATLLNNGVPLAGSSDCPIVPPNPLIGIYSAVSRRSEMGQSVLVQQCITPLEALRMYTTYAARATFEEKIKGSITPGKFADIVVLSNDPTICPTEEIKDIQVEMTVLNGEVVYKKNGLPNNPSFDVGG